MPQISPLKRALDDLSEKWDIPTEIYDMQLGRRTDVLEKEFNVGRVIFHIPYLAKNHQYILWKCLWPDRHNCCEKQLTLPLVKEDIKRLTRKLGHGSEAEFVKNETLISTIEQRRHSGNLLITLTMISLKRVNGETEEDENAIIPCRFLNSTGCSLHPDKPSVCSIYPFSPTIIVDTTGKLAVHASFRFTGNCPGFYVDNTVDSMTPILEEYSRKIYAYSMAFNRTLRENYGCASKLHLQARA